jgi:cellulose synthase/poly-beta-1,6-N-acetylglucosamine synthase-like glycosyltransferase
MFTLLPKGFGLMNVFAFVSTVLLSIILFWAIYHAWILFAGLRTKGKIVGFAREVPKFSLIVPAKNEGVVIERCLKALLNIDYPKDKMEIIVVDGGSSDATGEICQGFSVANPGIVKIIREDLSKGKPAALNLALAKVTGEIVGVFDADSVPEKNVLRKVASYFQDPLVNALQGSTSSVNEGQNMLTKVASLEDKAWFQGLLQGRERLGLFVAFTGSCQFIRSSVVRSLDGWDETSLVEDVELSLRLVKRGQVVKFASDVSSGQETPFSLRGLIAQRTRWYRGYMESSLRYGSLLEKINRRVIDAETSLIGPFVMVICLANYLNWGLSLLFLSGGGFLIVSAAFGFILTSFTLVSFGVAFAFLVKPVRVRNVFWIPFIFVYWFLQMFIATKALLQIVFCRRRVWEKTIKSGVMRSSSV